MKNNKSVKQVSRLTGALLARKGTATPSSSSLMMNQVASRFVTSSHEQARAIEKVSAKSDIKEEAGHEISDVISSDSKSDFKSDVKLDVKSAVETKVTAGNKKVSIKKSNSRKSLNTKSLNKDTTNKRIAMTLRMEEEDHLKLRIFSAYTRKSCQVILSEALDVYLGENSKKIPELKIASQNS